MSLPRRLTHGPVCLAGKAILLSLLLAGCASPDPQPFQEFSKATAGAGTSTGKALKESIAQSRDGLIDSVQDLQAFNALKLYFRSEPGDYTWGNQPDGTWKDVTPSLSVAPTVEASNASVSDLKPSPTSSPTSSPSSSPSSTQWINYYYKPQRITAEIDAFNQTLSQYSSLLSSLAGKEYISDETFKKMATSLNAQTSAIGKRTGISAPKETAIFSASAMVLFDQYLKSRQKSLLHRAISENAEQIREFSLLGQKLTFLLSVPVNRAYGQAFDELQRQFEAAKTDGGRQKAVKSAVVLNDSMIDRWELFAQMDKTYGKLPEAHAELAKAADGKGGLAAISAISESADRLQKIYETLKQTNEKAAKSEAQK